MTVTFIIMITQAWCKFFSLNTMSAPHDTVGRLKDKFDSGDVVKLLLLLYTYFVHVKEGYSA